jgi:DNA replication protein DnaC
MNADIILDTLLSLKLPHMADALRLQLAEPEHCWKSFEERFFAIAEAELVARGDKRAERLLRRARIGGRRNLINVDFSIRRELDQSRFRTLANCDWIRARQKVLVTGPVAVGKTFLAGVLGVEAARQNLSVVHWRFADLVEELTQAADARAFKKTRDRIGRHKLVVIDNFLSISPNRQEAELFGRLLDHLDDHSAVLVASPYPVGQWYEQLGHAAAAEAIVDRLRSGAHHLVLSGDSLRKSALS